jgi:glycosyltransferase involved in cell wall biosynthesis
MDRPLRVMLVLTRLNVGGPSVHVVQLARRLRERGTQVTVVAGREGDEEGNMLAWAEALGIRPIIIEPLVRAIHPFRDAAALCALVRLMRRERPDVVHTHMAKAGTLGRLAAGWVRRPRTVHTYHGTVFEHYFSPPKARFFLAAERALARRTGTLIALSPALKEDLVRLRIGRPGQIEVIPLGVEVEPFAEAEGRAFRRELGIEEAVPLVGIVGRLTAVKNHELFLRAAVLVGAARPDVRFAVVGDGERRGELERAAAGLGLGGRIDFTGWRSDMPGVYAGLDVLALTSLNEGTPMTVLEAMAAGKPVVAVDVGGMADILDDGMTGYLVKKDAAGGADSALAARLLELLGDKPRAEEMGRAGRARIRERHSPDRLAGALVEIYRNVRSSRR